MIRTLRTALLLLAMALVVGGITVASLAAGLPMVGALLACVAVLFAALDWRVAWAMYFVSVALNGVLVDVGELVVRPELFGIVFLCIAALHSRATGAASKLPAKLVSAAALYLGALLFSSSVLAPEPARSLWISLQIVASVSAALLIMKSALPREKVVGIGTVVIASIAGFSLALHALNSVGQRLPLDPYGIAPDSRLIGFSIETNIFAAQMVGWLGVMWATGVRLSAKNTIAVVAIGSSVLLAGTRSAWLAALLLVAAILIASLRSSIWSIVAVVGLGAALIVLPPIVLSLGQSAPRDSIEWRLANLLNTSEGTGAYRVDIFSTALSEIGSFPRWLIGSGANSYSQFHPIDATNRYAEYLSNFFLATIYDGGVIALIGLASMLAVFVHRASSRYSEAVLITIILICASATNVLWLQFAWVYIAVGALPKGDRFQSEPTARESFSNGRRPAGVWL